MIMHEKNIQKTELMDRQTVMLSYRKKRYRKQRNRNREADKKRRTRKELERHTIGARGRYFQITIHKLYKLLFKLYKSDIFLSVYISISEKVS